MKLRSLLAAALTAAFATANLSALTFVNPDYSAALRHTHDGPGDIVSYDWDASGNLYYMTAVPVGWEAFLGGLFRHSGGITSQVVAGSDTEYAGASVVSIGDYVYYNTNSTSDKIFRFGTGDDSLAQVSNAANYSLHSHQGSLFIAGAPGYGTNRIFHTGLDAEGNFLSAPPADLGETWGSPGPLAFDAAGNLYYAPGFSFMGDMSIFKWSAQEVADAIADPGGFPLTLDGALWLDYSGLYGSASRFGGTSMAFDANGDLLLTITGFADPSILVKFGVDELGAYDGLSSLLLESELRLGELRSYDGRIYLAEGGVIYEVVPEPSTVLLLLGGLAGAGVMVRRRRRATAAALLMLGAAANPLHAGPYAQGSNDPESATDAPIPGFVGPEGDGVVGEANVVNPIFVGWATRIISYLPAPGVSAGFANPTKALGPVTGQEFDVVSLGDLYNPASPPKDGGVPVDPNVTGDAYGFIGYDQPGSITLGFEMAITNGVGADFAVFENGFVSYYTTPDGSVAGRLFAELAYVEVSTDGVHFSRFPSVSLTENFTGAYGTVDPTNLYNLAGKSSNSAGESWGTPFDLDDLLNDDYVLNGLVNLSEINYVRLVDIPGSGYYLDSLGNPIYDSWVTFGSGGFDLEALGVIHAVPEPGAGMLAGLAVGAGALAYRRNRKAA